MKTFYTFLFLAFAMNWGLAQTIIETEPNDDINQSGVITVEGNSSFTGNITLFSTGDLFDTWALDDGLSGDLTIDFTGLNDLIVVEWADAARSNNTRVWYLSSGSTLTLDGSMFYAIVVDVFSASFSEDPYVVNLSMDAALPVEMAYFEAYKQDRQVDLRWETETEVQNAYFEVERSADGSNFEVLTRIEGAGTTNLAQQYHYLDENPMETSNYYRLRQVDYDGSYEYSEVKHIEFEAYQGEISLFPNPTTDQLSIKLPEQLDGTVQIEIFDASGKRVYQDDRSADYLQARIDVRALGAGHYMMRIRSEQGGSSHRFTVLK
ncbi:MAG: T9SS type A sorting domain-containing protein [Bacteroidota bacterium]